MASHNISVKMTSSRSSNPESENYVWVPKKTAEQSMVTLKPNSSKEEPL